MDEIKNKDKHSDHEHWVIVNSCDIAEEAISLNKTTDSDPESESSISIISGVTTPNECHSEEELVSPNEELEKFTSSSRSSVEKIDPSDVENYENNHENAYDQENSVQEAPTIPSPPLIKVTEVYESTSAAAEKTEVIEEEQQETKDKDQPINESFMDIKQEEVMDEKPPPMICPRIIIQNAEKFNDPEHDDSLPKQVEDIENEDLEESAVSSKEMLQKRLQEPIMEIDEYEMDYLQRKYDSELVLNESDSYTDTESSSDYPGTQLITHRDIQPQRQEGVTAVLSQNGLFLGAMFVFATALLKLYLLKDNLDLATQSAFDYELDKLEKQYQSVDMSFSNENIPNGAHLVTVAQYCTAKHGSQEDPFHRKHRVEKCINKNMKKINNKEDATRKKVLLDVREKLLEIREKELEARERNLLERHHKKLDCTNGLKNNEGLVNVAYKESEIQYNKRDRDHLKELRKTIYDENQTDKNKKKTKLDISSPDSDIRNDNKILSENIDKNIEYAFKNFKNDDDILIITEEDPIEKLTDKVSNTEIFENKNTDIVTFKEIALALREKELVRKLQEYNVNLETRINDIVTLNNPKQNKRPSEDSNEKYYFKKEKQRNYKSDINKNNKKKKYDILNTNLEKEKSKYEYIHDTKSKISNGKKEYQKVKYNSHEKKDKFFRDIKTKKLNRGENDMNLDEKYIKENNHKKEFNDTQDIPKQTEEISNNKYNTIKNIYKTNKKKQFKLGNLKDELYIKYNPITDTIEIVNISKSEDKNFILLENSNKTVNGQWYINLHQARSMLRTKEKSADWYFDRVLYRELKRNKAKWYFDYMSGRQSNRECVI